MSVFQKLFGSGKKNKPPTAQEGMKKLRDVEDILKKKSDFLEKKIERQIAIAKKNGTTNKRDALRALKTKKNLERQLQRIDGTLTTLECQIEALENAAANVEVVTVLKAASQALEGVHKQLDVDEAHKIMDEATEQKEIADELADAVSRPEKIGGDSFDEDELLAELEELEQENPENQQLNESEPGIMDLPSVPVTEPSASTTRVKAHQKEDDDKRKEIEVTAL